MEVLLDAVAGLVGAGFRRARREPKPVEHVTPTTWLTAAVGAMVVLLALLAVTAWYLARFGLVLVHDDLFVFLAAVVLPIVVAGIGMTLGAAGWTVGIIRKLLAHDAAARLELAAVGAVGLLVGLPISSVVLSPLAVLVVAVAAVSAIVAIAPAAWRRVDP